MANKSEPRGVFTVSQLTGRIKALLEAHFPFLWVEGEISDFRRPGSGHYYFTLKDESARIQAVMFRGQNRNLKFVPEDGMRVRGLGRIGVYEPRGTYQLIFEYLEPEGVGALQVAFEQLKAKLAEAGLFDAAHKKPLPFLPRRIAVITSPTGAAIRDILQVTLRRFPRIHLRIYPVRVQGDTAADEIVAALDLLNQRQDADLAIVARGGGSLEDLQPFNSEAVARAIFASQVPVVSGVGHETDFTIADFVADLRAPTPSAAAELSVPIQAELVAACGRLQAELGAAFSRYLRNQRTRLDHLSRRLVSPQKRLADMHLKTDDLSQRMVRAIQWKAQTQRIRLERLSQQLLGSRPPIARLKESRRALYQRLIRGMDHRLRAERQRLQWRREQLHALSPQGVLARGYSITMARNRVVYNSDQVAVGDSLRLILAKGRLRARVQGKEDDSQDSEL